MAVTACPALESAIAPHLREDRTVPARLPNTEYQPPFPAYVARFPESLKDVVMAIFGAQYYAAGQADHGSGLQKLLTFMQSSNSNSPHHWELASVTDTTGAYNEIVIAYWGETSAYESWRKASGFDDWWSGLDAETEQHGWFAEVFLPSIDRYEAIFSDTAKGTKPEGAGAMCSHMSDAVQEHVYWGSMRDRLPKSQTDALESGKISSDNASKDTAKSRIRIPGLENLCVIRSGQDWSKTLPEEHKLYTETMHPVLTEGMNFLRDQGGEIGCFSCRFMDVLDPQTMKSGIEQTFGLAYFDDIASLEKWSKEHQTHLNIFGGFLRYAKQLNFQLTLHLYHEVLVLKPEQQLFEYIGCHHSTGMLGGLKATS